MFRLEKNEEMTLDLLQEFLDKHKAIIDERYLPLKKAYESKHKILEAPKKPKYKPDNRIVVNFPKYIVDTINGYFIGNPVKTTSDNEKVAEFVDYIEKYNDLDDKNAELSKTCDIYGTGYEMYYTDEFSELCIAKLTPIEAFMIYDDSIIAKPLYFVRRYIDRNNVEWGSISDNKTVKHFKVTGGIKWVSFEENVVAEIGKEHYFNEVPATEYVENDERQGLCEPIMSMANAYNKAISEKANDVDYFADAYLKVLGVLLEDEDIEFIRDNRVINLSGLDAEKIIAEFMDKPNNDQAQENLLDRLERHIFQIAMVANISDEKFGGSSGEALNHRTLNMKNLFKVKQRKFTSGLNRRYKLLFAHPASKVPADAWLQLEHNFFPNLPKNLKEESEIAKNLEGVTSKETQLKTISIVDDVKKELDRIDKENEPNEETIVDKHLFGTTEKNSAVDDAGGGAEVIGKSLNGAQTQSLIAIMSQYSAGSLSEGQAVNLISTAIGISKTEARAILNGELNE